MNISLAISHKEALLNTVIKNQLLELPAEVSHLGKEMVVFGLILAGFPGKIFPYCHLLLRAFSLTLLSYQYCLETCASQCFHHSQHDLLEYLVISHVYDCHLHMWRLRATLSAGWELARFRWLRRSCSNLQAAGGLEMGKNKRPTSRHPRISALQPVSGPHSDSIVCFGYKIPEFSRAYYIHFHHNSL